MHLYSASLPKGESCVILRENWPLLPALTMCNQQASDKPALLQLNLSATKVEQLCGTIDLLDDIKAAAHELAVRVGLAGSALPDPDDQRLANECRHELDQVNQTAPQ